MNQFDILRKGRKLILSTIEDYSIEQINIIPKGFNNNIAWNVAHLLVTQQLLCYKLANLPTYISEEMIALYKKGTAPKRGVTIDEFETIKEQFYSIVDQSEKDYHQGLFK